MAWFAPSPRSVNVAKRHQRSPVKKQAKWSWWVLTHCHGMKCVAHESYSTGGAQVFRWHVILQVERLYVGVFRDGPDDGTEGIRPSPSQLSKELVSFLVGSWKVQGLRAPEEAAPIRPGNTHLTAVGTAGVVAVAGCIEDYVRYLSTSRMRGRHGLECRGAQKEHGKTCSRTTDVDEAIVFRRCALEEERIHLQYGLHLFWGE